jgi:hypothetical protein
LPKKSEFDIIIEGLEEESERYGNFYNDWVEVSKEEMTKFGLLVEEGAKALAFHDTGEFEDSITADKAIQQGDEISVEIGSNSPLAVILHERPYKMGTHDKYDNGARFPRYYVNGRGRRTITKPKWRGFKAGRKYMQNVVTAVEPDLDKVNERIQERVFGTKRGK